MKKAIKGALLLLALLALGLVVWARSALPQWSGADAANSQTEYFTISAVGDCILCSPPNLELSEYGYTARMNGDYAYPFSNTVQYFESDDLSIASLECSFSDTRLYSSQVISYRAPADWANILSLGGIDFVSTANEHAGDFGKSGYKDTYSALSRCGVAYGKEGETSLITTESGLVVGIYCDYNDFYPLETNAVSAIEELKEQGAEYIICMFHWGGTELKYVPTQKQMNLARACIDAGAGLVYGSHALCLQPIEEYGDGLILYGMGIWSYGGSTMPKDPDTAIVQLTLRRDSRGRVSNAGYDIIPCSVSSLPQGSSDGHYNDYCPTPYSEDSEEYQRVLSKLNGTYDASGHS